jgi:hypothetical protein
MESLIIYIGQFTVRIGYTKEARIPTQNLRRSCCCWCHHSCCMHGMHSAALATVHSSDFWVASVEADRVDPWKMRQPAVDCSVGTWTSSSELLDWCWGIKPFSFLRKRTECVVRIVRSHCLPKLSRVQFSHLGCRCHHWNSTNSSSRWNFRR